MRFQPSFLDEIRARLPCSQVVGRKVKLRKEGREWRGLSPFNQEKTPSFFVNDAKGRWFDFSAGKDGDIFSFVMESEGLAFAEAVERLARDAGLPLPKHDPQSVKREAKRLTIIELLEAAQVIFQKSMTPGARKYLRDRGVDNGTANKFGIGYAPDGSILKKELGAGAVAAGLVVEGDDIPVPYDRFRARIMFPIRDLSGKIVGFGGRLLSDSDGPKYLNSPETEAFHKGSILYNGHAARQPAHDGEPLLIVEGYFDVVSATVAGFPAAVSTMGTALTERQLLTAWRMSTHPLMCLDADAAGRRAARKAILTALPLLLPGRSLRFVTLPAGHDPDSLVRERGREALKRAVGGAEGIAGTLWAMTVNSRPTASPDDLAAIESEIMGAYDTIADGGVRQKYKRDAKNRLWQLSRRAVPVIRSNGHSHHSTSPGSIRLTRGLDAGQGLTMKEAVMLAGLVKNPDCDPEKIDDANVSEHVKTVLSEILYLIGSVPPEELDKALTADGRIARAVEEAKTICRNAGLGSLTDSV